MATPVYSEETFLYELLLRFSEQEGHKGELSGAHVQTITQVLKGTVVLNTTINPPEQLALHVGEAGTTLASVLGDINAATLLENEALRLQVADLQKQIDDLNQMAQMSLRSEQPESI